MYYCIFWAQRKGMGFHNEAILDPMGYYFTNLPPWKLMLMRLMGVT